MDQGLRTHPAGQQAGLLLASRAQVWPFWQHMSLKAGPRAAGHEKVLAGHCALATSVADAGTGWIAVACDATQERARTARRVAWKMPHQPLMTGGEGNGSSW